MEHERRSNKGTLIKDFEKCIQHSFNERTKTLESFVFIHVPVLGGGTHFHKVTRNVVCELETGKHTEMNSAFKILELEIKCLFTTLDSVSEPVVQYDDETGHHVEIGKKVKYVNKKKMFWPPVVKFHDSSGISYLDFCEG